MEDRACTVSVQNGICLCKTLELYVVLWCMLVIVKPVEVRKLTGFSVDAVVILETPYKNVNHLHDKAFF